MFRRLTLTVCRVGARALDHRRDAARTDTNSGYATYTNKSTGRCLTGRSPVGFPVVTAEKCIPSATKQQRRFGVAKDFQLRLNGVAVDTTPPATARAS
jgi:hypothetical protein